MNARAASAIIRKIAPPGARVSAREVSFEDLTRGSRVCVTVSGVPYSDRAFWDAAKELATANRFIVN